VLRHAAWPESYHPLIHINTPHRLRYPSLTTYAFVLVEGDGVHEIPVGPIHAGNHRTRAFPFFRWSVKKFFDLRNVWGMFTKALKRRFSELPMLSGSPIGGARSPVILPSRFRGAYCQAPRRHGCRALAPASYLV